MKRRFSCVVVAQYPLRVLVSCIFSLRSPTRVVVAAAAALESTIVRSILRRPLLAARRLGRRATFEDGRSFSHQPLPLRLEEGAGLPLAKGRGGELGPTQ